MGSDRFGVSAGIVFCNQLSQFFFGGIESIGVTKLILTLFAAQAVFP